MNYKKALLIWLLLFAVLQGFGLVMQLHVYGFINFQHQIPLLAIPIFGGAAFFGVIKIMDS